MYKKMKIIISLFLLGVFLAAYLIALFSAVDDFIYDNLLIHEKKAADNIIIVGIDERSINEIGTWPWPRFYVADAIEKLAEHGASAIGVSILYDTYSQDEESDFRLVAAAEKTDRLVLSALADLSEDTRSGFIAEDYILPFSELSKVAKTGFMNVEADRDGVMRKALTKISYGDTTINSLPYEVYQVYCKSIGIKPREDIPLDDFGRFPIAYTAKPGNYINLSLWGIINDEYNPLLFHDAIVLIGPYAQGLGTDYLTPLDRRVPVHSVEINANILQNMLEGAFKREAPAWAGLLIMATLGTLAVFFLSRFKPILAAVAIMILVLFELAVTKLAYEQLDIILRPGHSILFLLVCYLAYLVLSILSAQHEKHHIQGLFGRFVAPEVVKEIVEGNVSIELGGSVREVTVLFVDIRGFTAFSEAHPPEIVVTIVNRYLTLTSTAIQQYGGTIDKYIGDATMAVFNAPNDLPDHALCAARAAWAMKEGSAALHNEIMEEYGVDLQFGIGVNTGAAVIGNMGSDFRMDYTAIGDTVNTAARLEGSSLKGQIILSDATYQAVKDQVYVTDLGVLKVKNKKVGIQIYSLDQFKD